MKWCRMLFFSGFILVFGKQFISAFINTYSKGEVLVVYKHASLPISLKLH